MHGRPGYLAGGMRQPPFQRGSPVLRREHHGRHGGQATQAPFELAKGIGCPVLFHFGEIDANPSQDDMRTLDEELTRLGIAHQFYTYPGADHGFMDYTGARFQKQASEVSWARTLNFFDKHLKGAAVA